MLCKGSWQISFSRANLKNAKMKFLCCFKMEQGSRRRQEVSPASVFLEGSNQQLYFCGWLGRQEGPVAGWLIRLSGDCFWQFECLLYNLGLGKTERLRGGEGGGRNLASSELAF